MLGLSARGYAGAPQPSVLLSPSCKRLPGPGKPWIRPVLVSQGKPPRQERNVIGLGVPPGMAPQLPLTTESRHGSWGARDGLYRVLNRCTGYLRVLAFALLGVVFSQLFPGRADASSVIPSAPCAAGNHVQLASHDGANTDKWRADAVVSRARARSDQRAQDVATIASATRTPAIDKTDTAWMSTVTIYALVCTVSGLALFYGASSQAWLQHVAVAGVATLLWVAVGYSLSFSTSGMVEGEIGWRSVIGSLDKAWLGGVSEWSVFETFPEHLWVVFQMIFAANAPCILLAAFVRRVKLTALMVFTTLWSALVYYPVAHSLWGGPGGLLADLGVLDYAGGLVVHVAAGFSGLMAAVMLGFPQTSHSSTNMPLFLLGSCALWFGGLNLHTGSALTPAGGAATALINTQCCVSAAAIAWLVLDWINSKPSLMGVCVGGIAGLVCIAPGAAFVGPQGALVMGVMAAVVGRWVSGWLNRAFGSKGPQPFALHGAGGFLGNILTGVFAHPRFGGNQVGMLVSTQVAVQCFSGMAVVLYSMLATFILLLVTRIMCGGFIVPEADTAGGADIEDANQTL